MKLQYAPFLLPLWPDSLEQEAVNRFIQTRKEPVSAESQQYWALLVEYLDTPQKEAVEIVKSKIDYKEVLSAEDFALFSKLREVRKKLAEDKELPVYAICTNEQLYWGVDTFTTYLGGFLVVLKGILIDGNKIIE